MIKQSTTSYYLQSPTSARTDSHFPIINHPPCFEQSQWVSFTKPPLPSLGVTATFFSNDAPPPSTSGSAANFFSKSKEAPFERADWSVAWRKTLGSGEVVVWISWHWETRRNFKARKGGGRLSHFGTTGSSSAFLASTASFHRVVQRHHLQPGWRPMLRRLLPREAEKSRNSCVRIPVGWDL